MIGLKLADGRFFPVLEETDKGAKQVILTTARHGQTQAKVDLFRGDPVSDPTSWEYIASLVLEHIEPFTDGKPQLQLTVKLLNTSTLGARIKDERSGEFQSLRIDIESLECCDFSLPDFDLEAEEPVLKTLSEPLSVGEDLYDSANRPPPPHPYLLPALLAFVLLCLIVLGIIIYFLFLVTKGTPPPSLVYSFVHSYKPFILG